MTCPSNGYGYLPNNSSKAEIYPTTSNKNGSGVRSLPQCYIRTVRILLPEFYINNYLIGRYLCVVDIKARHASWICRYTKRMYGGSAFFYQWI